MIETVQPHPHTARIEQEIGNQPAYRLKDVYNNRADGKLRARSEVVASILRANKMKPMDVYSKIGITSKKCCLLYTSASPRDRQKSRMPSSA